MWFNPKHLIQSQARRLASASQHCGSPHHMLYDYTFSVFYRDLHPLLYECRFLNHKTLWPWSPRNSVAPSWPLQSSSGHPRIRADHLSSPNDGNRVVLQDCSPVCGSLYALRSREIHSPQRKRETLESGERIKTSPWQPHPAPSPTHRLRPSSLPTHFHYEPTCIPPHPRCRRGPSCGNLRLELVV